MTYEDFRMTEIPDCQVGEASIRTRTASGIGVTIAALHGESIRQGDEITALYVRNRLVMSDTRDEYRDHIEAIRKARGRVLIHGLGLGCYLKAILVKPEVEHVDVVEIEPDVISLVGPLFREDDRVVIHQGDAYTFTFPKGTTWDVAWHDIWADKCVDDLAGHAKMNRRYARKVDWQGCWAHDSLLYQRRRDRGMWWAA